MNKFLNKFSPRYFLYHLSTFTIMSCSNIILISRCKEENMKRNIHEVCGMLGSMWLPFDYDFFPVKQLLFAYQVSKYTPIKKFTRTIYRVATSKFLNMFQSCKNRQKILLNIQPNQKKGNRKLVND